MQIIFTYDGVSYQVGSLLVREAEAIEAKLGVRYVDIRPLGSMRDKLAIMATFLLRSHSEEEVAEIIDGLSLDAAEEMWTVEDDDTPDVYVDGMPDPKAGGSATPG